MPWGSLLFAGDRPPLSTERPLGAILAAFSFEAPGIEPRFVTWEPDGKSEIDYVMDLNFHRRQLSAGQRAMVAQQYATLKAGRPPSRETGDLSPVSDDELPQHSLQEAADRVGVSTRMVEHAKAVKVKVLARDARPEVVELVESNLMSVGEEHAGASRSGAPGC